MKNAVIIIFLFFGLSLQAQSVKFAVIADVHQDIMHDAEARLQDFLDAAKKNKVDFIIELGDFCQAIDKNIPFVNLWNSFEGDKYHVLGNHDMDACDKPEHMKFVQMKSKYYSFDKGDFHFIVLDPNNILVDGEYKSPFRSGRYGNQVDPAQLAWLKKDLASTDKKCVVFSHQSFERAEAVLNGDLVRKMFEEENAKAGKTKVVAAFSGHDHTDYQKTINGIAYIQINSASNQWVGDKYKCESRYSEAINKANPYIKYTAPYTKSLYGIVTLKKNKLTMKGTKSDFVSPTPAELNIPSDISSVPLVSVISDFKFKF